MLTGLLSGLKWINWLNTHGGWSETPPPLTPIQLLVIFAANPSVLRDLRIYLAAVKIGRPADATPCAKGNCALSQVSLRIRKPRWGIFRRILHVTAISIARSNIKILCRQNL